MRRTPAAAAVLFTLTTLIASTVLTGAPASGANQAGTPSVSPSAEQAVRAAVPAAKRPGRTAAVGTYVPPERAYFAYPNRGKKAQMAIRNRVLNTIKSVNGGPRTSIGTPMPGNGTIRMVTWTFDDMMIAKALVAARARGVSVQIVAAKSPNRSNKPWNWLRKRLGAKLYRPGYPDTRDTVSFARTCRGACRGAGGTPHAKYFLFHKVGPSRVPYVVFQTSANLTRFAYTGQWNQAQVMKYRSVYMDYLSVFNQTRLGQVVSNPYRARTVGPRVADYFFPRPRATAAQDPVMQTLSAVGCTKSGYGGNGNQRTRIRIIQYAIYGDRGVWIAKRLRQLWNRGCDIKIIYGVSSRPVLQILRNGSGRGKVPVKQSGTRNGSGEIVKYNHSKWMTITGRWNGRAGQFITFNGSANWALPAFGSDEQMQRIRSQAVAAQHLQAFATTWKQGTSHGPPGGRFASFGRTTATPGVPEDAPTWGQGIYRYMTP